MLLTVQLFKLQSHIPEIVSCNYKLKYFSVPLAVAWWIRAAGWRAVKGGVMGAEG